MARKINDKLANEMAAQLDWQTLRAVLHALESQAVALDQSDRFVASPEVREAAAKLRAFAPTVEAALSRSRWETLINKESTK